MNSIIIALNTLKRSLKDLGVFTFMVCFPVIAAVVAVIMFGNPSVTQEEMVIKIGMETVMEADQEFPAFLEDTGKYNIEFIEKNELEQKVSSRAIDVGIVQTNGKIKLISLENDSTVQELRLLIEGYKSGADMTLVSENEEEQFSSIEQPRFAMGMLTMFVILFASAWMGLILEDKKSKTFMRTFCGPIRGYEVVLGNLIATAMLGTIQILLFLFVSKYIFKIDFITSLFNIFIILFAFLITAIGMGIGLAGITQDTQKFTMVNNIVAISTSFLGGSLIPLEVMNGFLEKVSNFMPQRWVMEAYEKLATGATLADIQINLWILLLFGVVFFTFGVKVLRPTEADV